MSELAFILQNNANRRRKSELNDIRKSLERYSLIFYQQKGEGEFQPKF